MSESNYPLQKNLRAICVVADLLPAIRIPLAEALETEAAEFALAAEEKEKDSGP